MYSDPPVDPTGGGTIGALEGPAPLSLGHSETF